VFPVPLEPRIDLAIVAGNAAKAENHAHERCCAEEQEDGDGTWPKRARSRVFVDRTDTYDRPHKENNDRGAPYQKRSEITPGMGWCNRLRGERLGSPRMEHRGVSVCALLIEDGRSHDIRGSALVALIRTELRYGCHSVVPDLATPYDTGLSDENFSSIGSFRANAFAKLKPSDLSSGTRTHTYDWR
jgi:hypothetical protein